MGRSSTEDLRSDLMQQSSIINTMKSQIIDKEEPHQSTQDSILGKRESIAIIVSLVVVVLSVFFALERLTAVNQIFSLNIPDHNFIFLPTLLVTVFAIFVLMFQRYFYSNPLSLRDELRHAWPLFIYFVFALGVLIFSYFNSESTMASYHFPRGWFLNLAILTLSAPVAYLFGALNRRASKKYLGYALATIVAAGVITGLGELFANLGFANFISDFLDWWKHTISTSPSFWVWGGIESMRISGFTFNPNYLGYIACICLAWSLTSLQSSKSLRLSILSGSLFMIFLSGSRGSLVIAIVLCVIFAYLSRDAIRDRLKKLIHRVRLKRLSPLTVAIVTVPTIGVLGIIVYVIPNFGFFGRFSDVAGTISSLITSPRETLSLLLSGRGSKWLYVLQTIGAHPWGVGLMPQQLVRISLHNSFLGSWLSGGPALFASLLVFLSWMLRLKGSKELVYLPFMLGIFTIIHSAIDIGVPDGAILSFSFFILGCASAAPLKRKGCEVPDPAGDESSFSADKDKSCLPST